MPVWVRLSEGSIPLDDEDAEDLYEALRKRASGAVPEAGAAATKIEQALSEETGGEVVLSAEEKRELWSIVSETEVEPSLRPLAEALKIDVRFFGRGERP